MKTVRFLEELESQSIIPTTSLDQRKDMAIFTGYCVLKNMMDVILYCAECSDRRLTHPVRSRSRRQISSRVGSDSSLESSSQSRTSSLTYSCDTKVVGDTVPTNDIHDEKLGVNIQSLYQEKVTDVLSQTKLFLSKLQPLTLRVEMLENIFSLLFLTHEDVQETLLLSEYNSDEGDDKSLSTEIVTPTLSPLKHSSGLKTPDTVPESSSMIAIDLDYDIPFEDTDGNRGNCDAAVQKNDVDMRKVEEALESMKSRIIDKRKRLKEDTQFECRHSSISENISSMSTNSSLNLDTIGFIVNDYLARDILAMLKDCILDVSAAKYQIYGSKADARERYRSSREVTPSNSTVIDVDTEEALCRLVRSSVTVDTLQKKIAQLERYTSEAHWRYQLVSDERIPRSPGEVLQEVVMTTGDSSDEEIEIRGLGPRQSSRKCRRSGEQEFLPLLNCWGHKVCGQKVLFWLFVGFKVTLLRSYV